ncbi:phage major capsid protein [Sulfurimonas sp.]|uniref:phage major capsid protein n=1 Tax=Sulfurimonas sp. TaxID=2022749 RepID=UPI0025D69D38|nr:phage major capsid protein [Sulfurimonas sp.]
MPPQVKTLDLKPQFREFEVKGVDEKNRTVELSFSSEDPYERYWGIEILDHSATSVDMERLNNSAPLLFNHDRNIVAGVIESAKIDNSRGKALVRFGKNKKANEIFSDVADGILTKVSVGYQILEMKLESEKNGMETYRVTRWQPYEISIVSIPADDTVGVGRGADSDFKSPVKIINEKIKEIGMTPEEKAALERQQAEQLEAAQTKAMNDERARVREISAMGKKHKLDDLSTEAIEKGTSANEFRAAVLEKLGAVKQIDGKGGDVVLSDNEVKSYSLTKAISAAITGDWSKAQDEKTASDKVAKMLGKDSRGFYVPHQVLQRDLTAATSGAAIVDTTSGGANFIEILRNKLVIAKLGGKVLSGLSGNVAIPKQTGTSTAYWINEGGDTTASELGLGLIELKPKTVSAKTAYTRQMLLQGNPEVEALVMNDLAANIALAIDKAAISGTGANGQPLGLLNTTGINGVDCSAGLSWAKVVDFDTQIANSNADIDNMNFISGAGVTGKLKTTLKAANGSEYLLEKGEVNGYNHTRTNQVAANTLLFGDFSQMITGLWGGLDIMIDPYEKADSGGIVIRAFQSVDIGVKYAEAFTATTNIDQV